MLTDAMSEPVRSRSLPQVDRPLRRMLWVVPVSLSLWTLILAGFGLLLGNSAGGPSVPPLEVSLTDLGHGAPGGLRGGGPGSQGSGEGMGLEALGASLPAARSSVLERVAPSGRHPVAALEHRPDTIAARPRRKRLPKPAMRSDEDSAARFTRPAQTAAQEQVEDETRARPQRRHHEPVAMQAASLSGATRVKPAAPGGSAIVGLGGTDAVPASGSVSGSGASANGSGGQGQGTGGGIGDGSQAYATVEHPPVPISRVLPEYPGAARAQGVEGEVVLRAIVDQHGAVERDIVVVESVPVLDPAAIEALRQWHFEPGRDAANRAVRVVIEVPLRFRLR
jgi:protein TonB